MGDDDGSSDDGARGSTTAFSGTAAKLKCSKEEFEDKQRAFYTRLNADMDNAKLYIQSVTGSLGAAIGDWQASAVGCGILVTPEQIEAVQASLPFQVRDTGLLVRWALGLQSPEALQHAQESLGYKYVDIASNLNALLQYIEVNLTAIRKILKKFEKKMPIDMRIPTEHNFKNHQNLFSFPVQQLIIACTQIRILLGSEDPTVVDTAGPSVTEMNDSAASVFEIGPESLAMLKSASPDSVLTELLGLCQDPIAQIDVYAQPAQLRSGSGAGIMAAAGNAPGAVGNASTSGAVTASATARNAQVQTAPSRPAAAAETLAQQALYASPATRGMPAGTTSAQAPELSGVSSKPSDSTPYGGPHHSRSGGGGGGGSGSAGGGGKARGRGTAARKGRTDTSGAGDNAEGLVGGGGAGVAGEMGYAGGKGGFAAKGSRGGSNQMAQMNASPAQSANFMQPLQPGVQVGGRGGGRTSGQAGSGPGRGQAGKGKGGKGGRGQQQQQQQQQQQITPSANPYSGSMGAMQVQQAGVVEVDANWMAACAMAAAQAKMVMPQPWMMMHPSGAGMIQVACPRPVQQNEVPMNLQ